MIGDLVQSGDLLLVGTHRTHRVSALLFYKEKLFCLFRSQQVGCLHHVHVMRMPFVHAQAQTASFVIRLMCQVRTLSNVM